MHSNMREISKELEPLLKSIKRGLYLLKKNRLTTAAAIITIIIVLLGIIAPYIVPYPEHVQGDVNPEFKFSPPGSKYLFGTDELGRDIFSRVLYGTRISLQTGILALGLSLLIGVPLGVIAGYSGGMIDEVIMRITDIFVSFPPMLLAMALPL